MDHNIDFQYIMVTNWSNHWDKLERFKHSTLFTLPMIKDGIRLDNTIPEAKTIFIKLNVNNQFEKAWIGKSNNFRSEVYKEKKAIRFDISELREFDCPPALRSYSAGWHLYKQESGIAISTENLVSDLQPSFFQKIDSCNAETFELYCFQLLRLIGIHDLHYIPKDDNRGKADGFFRFHTLAVIYDATLETNFLDKKDQQIDNYLGQLRKDEIHFNQTGYTIKDSDKQVWIIVRKGDAKIIKTKDHITVKVIPIKKLMDLFERRLSEPEMGMIALCEALKNL